MKACKTFFIRTYGCQMNELDSEIMRGMLEKRGLIEVEGEETADLILFNTCSIRDLAERKVLGKMGKLSKKKKRAIIGITGCMANAKKGKILKKFPKFVDFVLGTNNIADLNTILDEVLRTNEQQIKVKDLFENDMDYFAAHRKNKVKAYVSISRGCNNFCSYCVVPYTRGREVSRESVDILEECTRLRDQGYKEIILLGQNVNSYGLDKPEWNFQFHDLLYKIDQISGIERVRFLTSHPKDIKKELMVAFRDLKSLPEFVLFPLQSGSNRILKLMNRKYTLENYLEKVALFKSIVPNISIGTDIIVGFPSETEEEFLETCDAFKKIGFSMADLFSFSPRKGTLASTFPDNLTKEAKLDRLHRIMTLYHQISEESMKKKTGKTVEVLVEDYSWDNRYLKGRSRNFEKVIFEGDVNLIGTVQHIQLISCKHQTFLGKQILIPEDEK